MDSQGLTVIHSDSFGLTEDSQRIHRRFTLIHSDSQGLTKDSQRTHKDSQGTKTRWHIDTGGSKTAIQQRTPPRNTHETQTTQRDHHTGTLSSSTRSRIIGQNSKSSNF